jgi:branched-chain amino acid transport system substrate-binding protein
MRAHRLAQLPTPGRPLAIACGALGSLVSAALYFSGPAGVAACGQTANGGGTSADNPAGPPIVLGASVPLTGSLDGNKRAMQGGLLAAVQQVNALGGILGRQVQVAQQDDTSQPAEALTVAQSLFMTGASVLIGPAGSSEVQMVESYAAGNKWVEVSSTATSAELTASQNNSTGFFFRTVPSDAYQALAVGIFALEGPTPDAGTGACHRMDIVYNMDTYGQPLEAAITQYFTSNGGTIPSGSNAGTYGVQENAAGVQGYATLVSNILNDLPECLVMAVYPQTAAEIMEALSQALMASTPKDWPKSFFVIGTDATYDTTLISFGETGPGTSYVNGTIGPPMYGTVAYTNDTSNQAYNDLVTLYVAEVGLDPGQTTLDPYTSNEYDAAILTMLAMQAAGTSTDGAAIQKAMFAVASGTSNNPTAVGPPDIASALSILKKGGDINYQGASGDVDFTPSGDVIGEFLVWQVSGSAFVNHTVITTTALTQAQGSE